MAKEAEKDKAQRKVYVLPQELVERLARYQQELGLSSEVEAVRRLLDGALKSRDTYETLIKRFVDRHKTVRDVREAAKEVLVDHPLVTTISFNDEGVYFKVKSGHQVTISEDRTVSVHDEDGRHVEYPKRPNTVGVTFGRTSPRTNDAIDDDIPF